MRRDREGSFVQIVGCGRDEGQLMDSQVVDGTRGDGTVGSRWLTSSPVPH